MFLFTKGSGKTESLIIKIITSAALFSGFIQILCAITSNINMLRFKDERNTTTITMDVKPDNNETEVCGPLGCLIMPSVSFIVDTEHRYLQSGPGNLTTNFTDTVQLSCPPVNINDTMIFWIKAKSLQDDNGNFTVTGTFLPNHVSMDERYNLTLANVTGREQRWYACILVKENFAAISYGYLTVLGDTNINNYYDNIPMPDNLTKALPAIIGVGVLFFVAVLTVLVVAIYKRRRGVVVKYWTKTVVVEKPPPDASHPDGELMVMPIVKIEKKKMTQTGIKSHDYTLMSEYQFPLDTEWELMRTNISLTGKLLGEGEFGKVVKAEYNGLIAEGIKSTVAVKMLKEGHSDADVLALTAEMEIMKMIGKHENIINLVGCCSQDGPLYVVVEYASNGCLREFLKKYKPNKKTGSTEDLLNKRLTPRDLVDFMLQIAKGMEYLASRGCLHRDLAARNVLVSGERVMKVADFGLARDVRDHDYYRKKTTGKLPVKWMAPESLLKNVYTKRSDVWSFGVLMWEIMTFGGTPYSNIPPQYLYHYLKTGNRLERPAGCTDQIHNVMKRCCAFDPEDRPTFGDLVQHLKAILQIDDDLPTDKSLRKQNDYYEG